jgi:hypothetical protein
MQMHTDIRFVIAPHEIEDHLRDMERLFVIPFGIQVRKRIDKSGAAHSDLGRVQPPNVLIIDNIEHWHMLMANGYVVVASVMMVHTFWRQLFMELGCYRACY